MSRALTFERWHAATRWLPACLRRRLFFALPERLQASAWADLAQELERERAS